MKILFHWTLAELLYLCLASYRTSIFLKKVSTTNPPNIQHKAFSFACIRQCARDDACVATNILLGQLSCIYLNRTQWESTITFDEIIYLKTESNVVQSSVSPGFPQTSPTATVPTATPPTTTLITTPTPTTITITTTSTATTTTSTTNTIPTTTTSTTTTTTTTVPTTTTATTISTTTTTTTTTTSPFTTCQNGGGWSDGTQTTCTCIESFAGTFCERYWEDCAEGYQLGSRVHNVYTIHPRNYPTAFDVYCSMKFGGRTYIQKQATGIDFRQTWQKYRDGFGNIAGDHWLGLAKVKAICDLKPCHLIIQMKYASVPTWKQVILHHADFTSETDGYRLYYEYRTTPSNANNGLPPIMLELNGSMFSTYDQDNDASVSNCADTHGSGWWFKDCTPCNPNGRLKPIKNKIKGNPLEIFWTGETRGTKETYMALEH